MRLAVMPVTTRAAAGSTPHACGVAVDPDRSYRSGMEVAPAATWT